MGMGVYVLLLLFLFLCFSCSILSSIVCSISYNSSTVFNFVGLFSDICLYLSKMSLCLYLLINSLDGS